MTQGSAELGVYVTKHGYVRMKERMGLNKNAARRMSRKAFKNGIDLSNVSGSLLKYIAGKDEYYPESNIIKIYGEAVYCYNLSILGIDKSTEYVAFVTVYPLPKKYTSQALGYQKKLNKEL